MKIFNEPFFQKYLGIMGETYQSKDFLLLHKKLGGKNVYDYLGIQEDTAFGELQEWSSDKKYFMDSFRHLNFEDFKESAFIFKDERCFDNYTSFLKFQKLVAMLTSVKSALEENELVINVRNLLRCDRNEAMELLSAAKQTNVLICSDYGASSKPIVPAATRELYKPDSSDLSDEVKKNS